MEYEEIRPMNTQLATSPQLKNAPKLRRTGIGVVGDVPWGTHFFLFYEATEDLLETLVPYFRAGLEDGEFCMWVVPEPLTQEEALAALRRTIPGFDRYRDERNMELVQGHDWYLHDSQLDVAMVARKWDQKLDYALSHGYSGLRLAGSTAWLAKKDWKEFCDYEKEVNDHITDSAMTALCTYPLQGSAAAEILDVTRTHQFAIARRKGGWEVVETSELKQAKAEIKKLNDELEQRVVERTAQLLAVNEELTVEMDHRRRAEEDLRRSETFLAQGQNISHTGSFGLNVSSGEIHWSDETYKIFELERAAKPTLEWVLQRIHPDDRDLVQQTLDRSFAAEVGFDLEHRLLTPAGSIKHVHALARAEKTSSGKLEFVGTVTDITERKRTEEALRRSERYLAEAQRLAHMGSWVWRVTARDAVYLSDEWYRIYGFDPDEGPPSWSERLQRIHPEDRAKWKETIDRAIDERSDYEVEFRILLPDGTVKYVHSVGHPVLDTSGHLMEFVGSSTDISERKQAEASLQTAFEEIQILKDQLYKENLVLREEVDRASMFEEIVGASSGLQRVIARISKVAPTDSTVLITGETGTGKELIARAIHKRSKRANRAFVSVNCAALPQSLIGSELFGHEKGAFTGAQQRRLGRFELADGGTIFLDEVGELPAETQVSLLRVLQEHQFERVGGSQLVSVDLRVLAATNRDLKGAMSAGQFRTDLFYRLNVFPIDVPPIRERKEDIPILVEYFIKRYAGKLGKKIHRIEKKTLEMFESYYWPGNIRELQNVIERSVIVCADDVFSVDEGWLSSESPQPHQPSMVLSDRLLAQEKELIESALMACAGRISGSAGAAARLGIPPSTLDSRIKALNIPKNRFRSQAS
jgi:PAS domain S-box-containing protein